MVASDGLGLGLGLGKGLGRGRGTSLALAAHRRGAAVTVVTASVLALLLALTAPVATGQLPPTPLDSLLEDAKRNATATMEATLGPSLTNEDVDVSIDMQFRDVDLDTVNVIFGGGKFSAAARIQARVDIRVIAASRIQGAAEDLVPGLGNATSALGADQAFIPADAVRASFAGAALAAFQEEQETRVADYLRHSIPNVTVMNTELQWSNVSPQDSLETGIQPPPASPSGLAGPNDPTEPPLTLVATIDVQYLERTSMLSIVEKAIQNKKSAREKERDAEVADAAAAYDRSAFGLLGIRQVLDLQAPRGWNLDVKVTLPEGFTFEEASPDVALANDLRGANVLTLGRDADAAVLNPVALTLSNRFIVSTAMLCTVLLAGAILRFPALLATNAIRRRLRR
ncbi:MAG TPA: hypothetical protein VM370_04795 [Candidatus Thermoplasmatota archaeon]|nr:hypothetical protein [Candidatus Thermoplasmatota archaeon]